MGEEHPPMIKHSSALMRMGKQEEAAVVGGDATSWDEDGYRESILLERELRSRTVFRTLFSPSPNPNPEALAVASSDGSVAAYSVASCISANPKPLNSTRKVGDQILTDYVTAEPLGIIQAHKGPAYDLKFYGDGDNPFLLSCGDDGHIRGWKWMELLNSEVQTSMQGTHLKPTLDVANPQHEGPWGALSPIPENNAIAVNEQDGSIFSAAGDSCAYCWDVETGKRKAIFKGHSDYLHCIVARKSSRQIITGSEDGTVRIWDCRSGTCTQVISPEKGYKSKESSWVSCIAIDQSENWLVCGTGSGLSACSLLSCECIFSVDKHSTIQDVLFDDNQILAVGSEPLLSRYSINGNVLSQIQCAPLSAFSVCLHSSGVTAIGGYGGLVDVISDFGSHLCTFCCRGMNGDEGSYI
ncbi:THO complex subunit 6 isoform X1 [Iris pallida]|uniref:THO complex subunit 6 isoform X1 n=2 Tax=Iris pallida TaxID=29817 RepID=A0AAX6DSB0_IRIPA|nr:THO complex subunit 6 isoform X1 [Iris pallida]